MDKRIIDSINSLSDENSKIIIAIEGSCASGKTTLSKEFEKIFNCNVIHMDDFFLPFEMRTEDRMKEIGGNIDYERFKAEIAENITDDYEFSYGKFDCSTGKISKNVIIKPKKINVIEGVYCMHPEYDHIYNLRIFLEIDDDEKIRRLRNRSPEKLERFMNEWIPKENSYFDAFKIKKKCDLILKNN